MTRLVLALLLVGSAARAQQIELAAGPSHATIDLATLPTRDAEILDRTDGGKRKHMRGVDLAAVLARLPPPAGADTLVVRCDDGWMSALPLPTVRSHHALLATAELVGANAKKLAAPRGPVFLTWPQKDQPTVDKDPDLNPNGWTWGVARLEYARASDLFAPVENLAQTPDARRGAALFLHHCHHCHQVHGSGGLVGWDLAQPPVLSYRSEAYVRAYVIDPRKQNPVAHMKSFRGLLHPDELDAIVAFLRSLH